MPSNFKHILLVDDNPNDIELTLAALEENHLATEVVVLRDGEEALDYMYRRGVFHLRAQGNPAVILLDLKLPKVDGMQVLEHLKSDEKLKTIPVVILTSSQEESDLIRSYRLGVNAYVVKAVEFSTFAQEIKGLGLFWALINHPPPAAP